MNKLIQNSLLALAVMFLPVFSVSIVAQQRSEYAGEEKRDIKSLSNEDIEELENGIGWGFAKAAELNGYPGPVHLLEMKNEIGLSESQVKEVEQLFESMKNRAVPLGKQLVRLERDLDRSFSGKTVDEKELKSILGQIEEARSELRYVHLSAHLKTTRILSKVQVEKYNRLRGYGTADPCRNIPEGHDPAMWKKHNGCDQ